MGIILACDLGGGGLRAALVDADGRMRAGSAVASRVIADAAGRAEIDPDVWRAGLFEAAGALSRAEPGLFAQIAGVAICGVTRTQVFLDHAGRVLRPAMTFADARSGAAARRLAERLGDHPEAGALNAFHPLARLAWLSEEEPETLAALDCVLEPKDYLNLALTGQRRSDPVSCARLLACRETVAGRDAFAALGLTSAILPAIREPHEHVGAVAPGLPAPFDVIAGAPVFCCSNDTFAAVAGLGALREGYAYAISGTTEVLGVCGAAPAKAEGLLTVDWRGVWQLGGPSQNGADTVAWLHGLVAGAAPQAGVGETMERLLAGRRDPQPALFLPYLQGERVPYWDPALRGAFVGLNRRHGPTDLAFALLEGVAFLNRIVLERAEAALGAPVREIRLGGGGGVNPVWSQIRADVCGRPVVTGEAKEAGVLGAALIALTGLGRFASLAEAQERLARPARRFEPSAERRAAYDALFPLFRHAETALAPLSRNLAAWPGADAAARGLHGCAPLDAGG